MRYIVLTFIISIYFSLGTLVPPPEPKGLFNKGHVTTRSDIYARYDSIYTQYDSLLNRHNLLILEIYNIRESLYELQDSTKKIEESIKYTINNLDSDILKVIQKYTQDLEYGLVYAKEIMNEQDSINASEVGNLEDRFYTFQSAQKIKNSKIEKRDRDFLKRLNQLERTIRELQSHLPSQNK